MKLIHTADLHLDSSLANFSAEQAKERRAELLDTFRRIVEYAEKEDVRAVLIAGDLFDKPSNVRKRTVKTIREMIAACPNIRFYYLSGNHDGGAGLFDDEKMPENFFAFSKGWTTYDLDGIVITAAQTPAPETLSLDSKKVNLVLLHGQVVDSFSASKPEEIPLRAYTAKGIDYLAMGHIHSFAEYRVDDRATACYSGTPEGRGFDECGEKGFVLLEIADGHVAHRFIPFARRTLHEIRLDLSGCNTQAELERRAEEALAPVPATDLVKLTVCGEVDPEFDPDFHRIDRSLSERFWFGRRKDESVPLIRPEDYKNDRSLKGEFIRLVQADLSLSDEERDIIIRLGLQALYGRKEIDL